MTIKRPLLCIIDGSSFLYRAHYALKPMHTPTGEPTQTVYGFARMLKKLFDDHTPDYCIVAWDSPGLTTRHHLFPAYKSNRQTPPMGLSEQRERIRTMLELMGIAQVAHEGIEADDLIASLVSQTQGTLATTLIVTNDKDLAQLVNETTFLYDAFKQQILGIEGIIEKYHIPPDRMRLYLALVGDSSDNIPGVTGIGTKGAITLATKYPSCEALFADLEQIEPPALQKKLRAGQQDALMSDQLVALQNYPLAIPLERMRIDCAQAWQRARPVFEQLAFSSLLKQMSSAPHSISFTQQTGMEVCVITTETALVELCATIRARGACALDTEGICGSSPVTMKLVGISLCCDSVYSAYIPLAHAPEYAPEQLSREIILKHLGPLVEDPSIAKYLHNAKFDIIALAEYGIMVQGLSVDTMIAAHLVLHEDERIGLKSLSEKYLQTRMLSFSELLKHHQAATIAQVPLSAAAEYAAADARQTWLLVDPLCAQVRTSEQWDLFTKLELPLVNVLVSMERAGIPFNTQPLTAPYAQLQQELIELSRAIAHHAGVLEGSYNINSPQQLETLLFRVLGLKPVKKTAGKEHFSTDAEVLTILAREHRVPQLILEYRSLAKLKNTYFDALPTFVNPRTGRIHTNMSQTATATGRLASSEPNLQNIPTEGPYAHALRSAFCAPSGYRFITADYSQIELRVLAHLSGDPHLHDAFTRDLDIHAITAAHLFETPAEQITHEQRQLGKRVNFSVLYGLSAYRLSQDLNMPYEQAKTYIEKYFARYVGVATWMATVIERTKATGYALTLGGRRRLIPGIHEKNKHAYDLACRMAVNTVAQGTAAEIMKQGMCAVDTYLTQHIPTARILLQIHDEILVCVPEAHLEMALTGIKKHLEQVVSWDIPLIVNLRTGSSWADVSK